MDQDAASKLGFAGTVVAALIAAWALLSGKSKSSPAETQEQINDGFRNYMRQSLEDRTELHAEIRGLKSYIQLLIGLLRSHGIPIPSMDAIQPDGYLLLPPDKENRQPN